MRRTTRTRFGVGMDDITPRTRLLAGAAIAAPLLLLASTVTYLAGDGLGDDPAGGAIQVYAAVAFGLAIIGLTARIEPHLPRLATALTVTGMVGVAGAVGFGQDSIVYSYNPLAALSEHESVAAGVALFFPGVVFPATLAGLGLAAARTRIAPRWAGALLAAGALCFPVSRIGEIGALALAADMLIAGGLVPIGLSAFGWHAPAVRAVRPGRVAA